jgi:hypothetical protein
LYPHEGQLLDTLVGCVAKQVLAGSVEKVLEEVAARPSKNKQIRIPSSSSSSPKNKTAKKPTTSIPDEQEEETDEL